MLKKLIVFLMLIIPCASFAQSNLPFGVGAHGAWNTEANRELVVGQMRTDADSLTRAFQTQVLDDMYVPIEAKLGRSFIAAMSRMGEMFKTSLYPVINVFLILMFIFWTMFEAWGLISTGGDAKETGIKIAKKALWLSFWLIILSKDPARLFMTIMGPVVSVGAYLSDAILNGVGSPGRDACLAIREYMAANPIPHAVLNDAHTADLLCMPTRLSLFFYQCVGVGLKWMLTGLGSSALTFVAGAAFVWIFIKNIWKFALQALGVIADLFIIVLTLPFTAIAELKFETSTKSLAADAFASFAGLFSTQGLITQVQRFINATIYFVVLSIVAVICLGLLGTVISVENLDVQTVQASGFIEVLLCGLLVNYLVGQAETIAKNAGGAIDNSFGDRVKKDAAAVGKWSLKQYDAIKKSFKKK